MQAETEDESAIDKKKKYLSFSMKINLTGIFGGFFGGLLGVGGSFLVIPFLSGALGLPHHKAHATALPVAFVSGLSALGFYFISGNIAIGLSLKVMLGSLLGVILGAMLMRYIKGSWLSVLFGFFLLFVAAGFALDFQSHADAVPIPGFTIPVLLGISAGIASGLFGAGGGVILVPGAVLLLQMNEQMAQGISLMAIIPTTLLGAMMHYKEGNISPRVAPRLMIAAFIGGISGGYIAIITHVSVLRGLLFFVLIYIGGRNIWKYWPRKQENV